MTKRKPKTDFTFSNHGSITVLTPVTAAAQDWADEYLPGDAMRWGGGIVIEPRYVGDILVGIQGDDLTLRLAYRPVGGL